MGFREVLDELTISEGSYEVMGRKIPYRVISRALAPDLPGFMGYQPEFIFLSEDIPEAYRPYVVVHEAVCNRDLKDRPNGCVQAINVELLQVPLDVMPEYLAFRRDFFDRLVAYYEANPTDPAFVAKITASRDHLHTLGKSQ